MVKTRLRLATCVLSIATGAAFNSHTGMPMQTHVGLNPLQQDLVPEYLDADPRVSITQQQEQESNTVSDQSAPDGLHKIANASFHTIYGFMHIPKTAGSSFAKDSTAYIPDGDGYYSQEKCANEILRRLTQQCEGDLRLNSMTCHVAGSPPLLGMSFELLTFLRHPVAHVYSQYLQMCCGGGHWKGHSKFRREVPNITAWLDRYTSGPGTDHGDYPLYHPQDMQTRSLVCKTDNHGYLKMTDDHLEKALEAVKTFKFIGITEHYQASMCVFHDKVQPGLPLPEFCDCQDIAKWSAFPHSHLTHGVPKHSLSDLSRADISRARRLTVMDRKVYKAALDRFHGDVLELEKRRGLRILCQ